MQIKITKDKIDFLIDTLITSGGGHNQYGKLDDIIKTYTTENSLIRTTLLIWLDTMGIMEVNKKNNYYFKKPIWVYSSIKNHFVLYGALTKIEKEKLENHIEVDKYSNNVISYKNFEIELPDTYYTKNSDVFKEFEYKFFEYPIFSAILNMDGLQNVKEKLYTGKIENIIFPKEYESNVIDGYKIILNANQETLYIYPQDDTKLFNWRTRNYIKCNLINELNIENEEDGIKLIKVTKIFEGNHKENYTFLLEKNSGKDWCYFYFDKNLVDDRWARYFYIDKLEFYDIEKDFRGRNLEDKGLVGQNVRHAIRNKSDIIIHNPDSNNFMKIPDVLKKQLVQYDSRQGLLAFPVSMPLPKEIMRYLFSCSGMVPQILRNNFVINPDYNVKRLFSGVLSSQGHNVSYPEQNYFMEEDFYIFSNVPKQLAEKIFEKLNLNIYTDVFKRTFLQKTI